jgi:hypothetical protein
MAFEQEALLLHQPVQPLDNDRGRTGGSPLALEERGDPPVSIGRSLIDKATDRAGEVGISPIDPRCRPAGEARRVSSRRHWPRRNETSTRGRSRLRLVSGIAVEHGMDELTTRAAPDPFVGF